MWTKVGQSEKRCYGIIYISECWKCHTYSCSYGWIERYVDGPKKLNEVNAFYAFLFEEFSEVLFVFFLKKVVVLVT
uniref:Uncharacterized protein n=1 Tax=Parascaris equorum TaxID=6256 RepID=A0A914S4T1_PAREQ